MGVPGVPKETAATPAHDNSTVATEVVFVLLGIIGSVILLVVVLSIVFGVLLKSRDGRGMPQAVSWERADPDNVGVVDHPQPWPPNRDSLCDRTTENPYEEIVTDERDSRGARTDPREPVTPPSTSSSLPPDGTHSAGHVPPPSLSPHRADDAPDDNSEAKRRPLLSRLKSGVGFAFCPTLRRYRHAPRKKSTPSDELHDTYLTPCREDCSRPAVPDLPCTLPGSAPLSVTVHTVPTAHTASPTPTSPPVKCANTTPTVTDPTYRVPLKPKPKPKPTPRNTLNRCVSRPAAKFDTTASKGKESSSGRTQMPTCVNWGEDGSASQLHSTCVAPGCDQGAEDEGSELRTCSLPGKEVHPPPMPSPDTAVLPERRVRASGEATSSPRPIALPTGAAPPGNKTLPWPPRKFTSRPPASSQNTEGPGSRPESVSKFAPSGHWPVVQTTVLGHRPGGRRCTD